MEKIAKLVDELRTQLLEIGLKPSAIAYTRAKILAATEKDQAIAVAWLEAYRVKELKEYQIARDLVPELTRRMYKMSGTAPSTHEEFQIQKKREAAIVAWRTRPNILQRKKPDERILAKAGKGGKGNPRVKGDNRKAKPSH